MDNSNLWTRRSNTSKLSLSMSGSDGKDHDLSSRNTNSSKRFGGDGSSHGGRSNPFNAMSPLSAGGLVSPSAGASSAFGLGSGAFASFGAAKTPKSPGNALDFGTSGPLGASPSPGSDKREKEKAKEPGNAENKSMPTSAPAGSLAVAGKGEHPIKYTWVVWYRPPTTKYTDYEKSTIPLASFSSVETFWSVYSHLKRPSSLPSVSDYHIFKKGVRPVWEDAENRKGGKWIVRLKKGVADRYWEDLLLAIVGNQFAEAGDEVCGVVLSVRTGEDVLSIWTRIDGGRNIKIRETVKRMLAFPPDTNIIWKSHDDSIAQRSAIDQARQEKESGGSRHHDNEHASDRARNQGSS